jgi:hypothetical protein
MITNRVIQKWWDSANEADYDFMRWSDFLATMPELKNTDTPAYDPIAGDPSFGGGAGPIPINDLLAADGTNTINNADYNQEWQWNSLSNGPALKLSSTSTAGVTGNKVLEIVRSGANASSSVISYGAYASVTNTGTSSQNYAGYFIASGASTVNRGVWGEGSTSGVFGKTASGLAVQGQATGANGVALYGEAQGTTGTNYGAQGVANGSGATRNIGGYFRSVNATDNHAIVTDGGNVGIGTTTPSSKAALEISSTTQGWLPPRMTTTQRDAISSPPEGLTVYDLTEHKWSTYNGSSWEYIDWAV